MTNEERAIIAVQAAATAVSGNFPQGTNGGLARRTRIIADDLYKFLLEKENER